MLNSYWLACSLGLPALSVCSSCAASHPRLRAFTTRSGIFDLLLLGSIFATGMLMLASGPAGLDHMVSDLMRLPTFPGNHPLPSGIFTCFARLVPGVLSVHPHDARVHEVLHVASGALERLTAAHDPHAAESACRQSATQDVLGGAAHCGGRYGHMVGSSGGRKRTRSGQTCLSSATSRRKAGQLSEVPAQSSCHCPRPTMTGRRPASPQSTQPERARPNRYLTGWFLRTRARAPANAREEREFVDALPIRS